MKHSEGISAYKHAYILHHLACWLAYVCPPCQSVLLLCARREQLVGLGRMKCMLTVQQFSGAYGLCVHVISKLQKITFLANFESLKLWCQKCNFTIIGLQMENTNTVLCEGKSTLISLISCSEDQAVKCVLNIEFYLYVCIQWVTGVWYYFVKFNDYFLHSRDVKLHEDFMQVVAFADEATV